MMMMRLGVGGRSAANGKGKASAEDAGKKSGDASALKLPAKVEETLANVSDLGPRRCVHSLFFG